MRPITARIRDPRHRQLRVPPPGYEIPPCHAAPSNPSSVNQTADDVHPGICGIDREQSLSGECGRCGRRRRHHGTCRSSCCTPPVPRSAASSSSLASATSTPTPPLPCRRLRAAAAAFASTTFRWPCIDHRVCQRAWVVSVVSAGVVGHMCTPNLSSESRHRRASRPDHASTQSLVSPWSSGWV